MRKELGILRNIVLIMCIFFVFEGKAQHGELSIPLQYRGNRIEAIPIEDYFRYPFDSAMEIQMHVDVLVDEEYKIISLKELFRIQYEDKDFYLFYYSNHKFSHGGDISSEDIELLQHHGRYLMDVYPLYFKKHHIGKQLPKNVYAIPLTDSTYIYRCTLFERGAIDYVKEDDKRVRKMLEEEGEEKIRKMLEERGDDE